MNLKTARKIAKLTQVELAERSGVTQQVISKLEKGNVGSPTYETVARLAKALNCLPEDLFPLDLSDVEA